MTKIQDLFRKNEKDKLNSWSSELEENIYALQKLIKDKNDLIELRNYKDYDRANAWKRVENHVDGSGYKLWLRIAAAVVIVIVCFFLVKTQILDKTEQQIAIVTTEKQQLTLPDGSQVTLDANSELSYFEKSFNEDRSVRFKGRAQFDVTRDPENRFKVVADDFNVEVLGTVFEVNTFDENHVVMVTEGTVSIESSREIKQLRAGNLATIDEDKIYITESSNTNLQSWLDSRLIFEDTPMPQVFKDLENHFQINFKTDSFTNNLKCLINTEFQDETLESILTELKSLFGAEYQIQNDVVHITHLQCD